MEYSVKRISEDELMHHGIKGQKWGVRRFENEDGSLTPEGKIRYNVAEKNANKYKSAGNRVAKTVAGTVIGSKVMIGAQAAQWLLSGVTPTSAMVSSLLPMLGAVGAIGGLAVTGIVQGVHAAKVRKGMNFLNKYENAHLKTIQKENGGQ